MSTILAIVITIIIASMILIQLLLFNFGWIDPEVPAIFKITKVTYGTNFDSVMVVQNTGEISYQNKDLYAMTYRNGIQLNCIISTMNGHDFISTHHVGIQNIKGMSGKTWYSNWAISINYKDKTFHPDDQITFEIYDNTTDQLISRDTYPHTTGRGVQWFYNYFLNPQTA